MTPYLLTAIVLLQIAFEVRRRKDHRKLMSQQGDNTDSILAQVRAQDTKLKSVIALLRQLKALADAAQSDPAKLKQIADLLRDDDGEMDAAIAENTPSAGSEGEPAQSEGEPSDGDEG